MQRIEASWNELVELVNEVQGQKRPVIDWVGGNTYEHYAEHIGWINQLLSESSATR